MTEPTITPQEPGAIAGVEHDKLVAIANGTVGDLAEALGSLTTVELDQLLTIEGANKGRKSAIQAIQAELAERDTGGAVEVAQSDKSLIGDGESYANRRARDVDPRKIPRPVLTLDGWVLPAPTAHAEG